MFTLLLSCLLIAFKAKVPWSLPICLHMFPKPAVLEGPGDFGKGQGKHGRQNASQRNCAQCGLRGVASGVVSVASGVDCIAFVIFAVCAFALVVQFLLVRGSSARKILLCVVWWVLP